MTKMAQARLASEPKSQARISSAGLARLGGRAAIQGSFIIQRLENIDDLAALVPEWTLIDAATRPRSPFTSPAWLLPWWKHFRRRNIVFRDEFFSHAVRSRDGQLVAIAPLMRSFAPGLGVSVVRILQFFGTDPSLTEFRGVICRHDDHDSVVEALFEYFLARRDEWDVFRWHGLRRSATDYNTLFVRGAMIPGPALPDYVLGLPQSWDAVMERLTSKVRHNLRKTYEKLEREGIGFGLRVVVDRTEVPAATERFLALHSARAGAADMLRHSHKFHTRHARAFLAEYLNGMATHGQLRLFELDVAGKVVASRPAFALGDTLYLFLTGYDPQWRQYGVMTVLMGELMQWAVANGMREINLSTGNDQSKLRWKPEEVLLHEAVLISPSLRGRAAFQAFQVYRRAADLRAKLYP